MQRREFSSEFKLEAVRFVRERGVAVAQAAHDLDMYGNVLSKWVRDFATDPVQALPGNGQMKPEQLEIERLRREVPKMKTERDILKMPPPTSRGPRYEVHLYHEASRDLAGGMDMRSIRCFAKWLARRADTCPVASQRYRDNKEIGTRMIRESSNWNAQPTAAHPAAARQAPCR